jgi:hypothetical protein
LNTSANMKTVLSTLLISIMLLAATPGQAFTMQNISDAKTLFFVVYRLEQHIPFRKKEVQRILDCKLHRHRDGLLKGSFHSKNYRTHIRKKGLLNQVTLRTASKSDPSFKGMIVLEMNEAGQEATMNDVCATFGDPDRESDGMVGDLNPDGKLHVLIYDQPWGTLIFEVTKTIDHRVAEVVLQTGARPKVELPTNGTQITIPVSH